MIKAIAWAVALVVAYLSLDRLPKWKKWLHSVQFAAFPVLFNLWLYWITKDIYFRFSDGEPLRWVAITDHGLLSYAKPGFGPDGKPLVQVTRENFKNFKNLSSPLVRIDPENAEWFSPNTAEAMIYYARNNDGTFEFFNRWGYHPGNDEELKPVTKQVKVEYEAWKELRLENEKRAKRMIELKTLFRPIVTDPKDTNIGVVVVRDPPASNNSDQVEKQLLSGLHNAAPKIVFLENYFTPTFSQKGYFDQAYQGDVSTLQEANALSPIDYLLLCRVKTLSEPNSLAQGLVTCRIHFDFRTLDKNGTQVNRGSFDAVGPGLSEEQALDRGMEMLMEKHSSEVLTGIVRKTTN